MAVVDKTLAEQVVSVGGSFPAAAKTQGIATFDPQGPLTEITGAGTQGNRLNKYGFKDVEAKAIAGTDVPQTPQIRHIVQISGGKICF